MHDVEVSDAEARERGFEDAFNGAMDCDNPYPICTDAHLSWNDGYESFFAAQEETRQENAKPDAVDPSLEKLEAMSVEEVAQLINLETDLWPGNCFAIASQIAEKLEWVGAAAVYGHYLGHIAPSCKLFKQGRVTHHGWILTAQGCVIDPTRWVFEDVAPYIAVYKPWEAHQENLDEYDEGGEKFVRKNMPPPPQFTPEERVFSLAWWSSSLKDYVNRCFSAGFNRPVALSQLSMNQVVWLANQPYTDMQELSGELYDWLDKAGVGGLVPLDFRRRATREGHFTP